MLRDFWRGLVERVANIWAEPAVPACIKMRWRNVNATVWCMRRASRHVPALCSVPKISFHPSRWIAPYKQPAPVGKNGTYTGLLFANEAVCVIHEHAAKRSTQPVFMYLALHDTHAPLEAPWTYVALYAARWLCRHRAPIQTYTTRKERTLVLGIVRSQYSQYISL